MNGYRMARRLWVVGWVMVISATQHTAIADPDPVMHGFIEIGAECSEEFMESCRVLEVLDLAGIRRQCHVDPGKTLRIESDDVRRLDLASHNGTTEVQGWIVAVELAPTAAARMREFAAVASSDSLVVSAGSDFGLSKVPREVLVSAPESLVIFLPNRKVLEEFQSRVRPAWTTSSQRSSPEVRSSCAIVFSDSRELSERCTALLARESSNSVLQQLEEIEERFNRGEISEEQALQLLREVE